MQSPDDVAIPQRQRLGILLGLIHLDNQASPVIQNLLGQPSFHGAFLQLRHQSRLRVLGKPARQRRNSAWRMRMPGKQRRGLGQSIQVVVYHSRLQSIHPDGTTVRIHAAQSDVQTDQDQAMWCFEMRDAKTPTVTLGQGLQIELIELRKADRLQQLSGPLADWVARFERWNEDQRMNQITGQPARAVLDDATISAITGLDPDAIAALRRK